MIIRAIERNKLFVSDFLTCITFPATKLRRKNYSSKAIGNNK